MNQTRGILFLADSMNADRASQRQIQYTDSITLIFNENERYLSLAQAALWRMRQKHGWVCVAAEGKYACVALALAAQLPVDRLVLRESSLFAQRKARLPKDLLRLESYARRNLSLVVSEILLIGTQESEVRGMLRGRIRGRTCALPDPGGWEVCGDLLRAPWEQVSRKNLLIP